MTGESGAYPPCTRQPDHEGDCENWYAETTHAHVWTRRRMTNGEPWWSCDCGGATDRTPTASGDSGASS